MCWCKKVSVYVKKLAAVVRRECKNDSAKLQIVYIHICCKRPQFPLPFDVSVHFFSSYLSLVLSFLEHSINRPQAFLRNIFASWFLQVINLSSLVKKKGKPH